MNDRAFTVTDRCPDCGKGQLRVRRRKVDREPFVGCSAFPRCNFVEAFDERLQRLMGELKRAQAKQVSAASPAISAIDSKIRDLIFTCHPDRNRAGLDGGTVVAALNDLRASLKAAA